MLSGFSASAPVTPMRCLRRRSTALTRFSTAECPTPNSFATTEYGVASRTRTSISIPLADEFELIKLMSVLAGVSAAMVHVATGPLNPERRPERLDYLLGGLVRWRTARGIRSHQISVRRGVQDAFARHV